jgi:hypothetical protein
MCKNIKRRSSDQPPTDEELELAALQCIRKVNSYCVSSRGNQEALNRAIEKVATATTQTDSITTPKRRIGPR